MHAELVLKTTFMIKTKSYNFHLIIRSFIFAFQQVIMLCDLYRRVDDYVDSHLSFARNANDCANIAHVEIIN